MGFAIQMLKAAFMFNGINASTVKRKSLIPGVINTKLDKVKYRLVLFLHSTHYFLFISGENLHCVSNKIRYVQKQQGFSKEVSPVLLSSVVCITILLYYT